MTDRPLIDLNHERAFCPLHMEPYRAEWPKGYPIAAVMLAKAVLEDEGTLKALAELRGVALEDIDFDEKRGDYKPGEFEHAIEALLDAKPACCRVRRGVLREISHAVLEVGSALAVAFDEAGKNSSPAFAAPAAARSRISKPDRSRRAARWSGSGEKWPRKLVAASRLARPLVITFPPVAQEPPPPEPVVAKVVRPRKSRPRATTRIVTSTAEMQSPPSSLAAAPVSQTADPCQPEPVLRDGANTGPARDLEAVDSTRTDPEPEPSARIFTIDIDPEVPDFQADAEYCEPDRDRDPDDEETTAIEGEPAPPRVVLGCGSCVPCVSKSGECLGAGRARRPPNMKRIDLRRAPGLGGRQLPTSAVGMGADSIRLTASLVSRGMPIPRSDELLGYAPCEREGCSRIDTHRVGECHRDEPARPRRARLGGLLPVPLQGETMPAIAIEQGPLSMLTATALEMLAVHMAIVRIGFAPAHIFVTEQDGKAVVVLREGEAMFAVSCGELPEGDFTALWNEATEAYNTSAMEDRDRLFKMRCPFSKYWQLQRAIEAKGIAIPEGSSS